MQTNSKQLSIPPKYVALLGIEQATKLLSLFSEIENGKYNKEEIHSFKLTTLAHPIYLRAIRADMQSFVNTFIDKYLDKKDYLSEAKFVIDAGANIGFTAVLFANWWPDCKIVSIEADHENYLLSKKNTEAYPSVSLIHGGLWNKSTLLRIEAGQEDGFVVREVSAGNSDITPENLCQGFSIPELCKQFGFSTIDFLKMNIEGSEKEIFSEDFNSWLPHVSAMLVELHDGKNAGCSTAVFNAISTLDFAVAETAEYGILFVKAKLYRAWYANWYKTQIYVPNINKERFPEFYLDKE